MCAQDLDVHPAHMGCLRRARTLLCSLHSLPRCTMGTPLIKTTEHVFVNGMRRRLRRECIPNKSRGMSACKSAASVLSSVKICYNNLSSPTQSSPSWCECRRFLALATPALLTHLFGLCIFY